ncbi:hypothetical protein [Sphingobacterium olei]|uniref:hypothetical protein n=1 Tax=Sphingobacterium olei TaxID=2571155 RepID=UPI00192E40F0|nr:hypothetical protein [Sphingobacterium olei]
MRFKSFLTSGIILFLLLTCSSTPFAQSANLTVEDSRDVSTLPTSFPRMLKASFKRNTSLGLPADGNYSTLLSLRGWSDDSGGPAHELAFSQSRGLYYRSGTTTNGWSAWRRVLVENISGNVGIGIDVPQEKLSVNGNIRAKEIKVEAANWPDYVFTSDYELQSLKEVENYIKKYGHLPHVPKADEVDANGISLGEMNKILLQKIEELTLHLIEKDKRVTYLEERMLRLENHADK